MCHCWFDCRLSLSARQIQKILKHRLRFKKWVNTNGNKQLHEIEGLSLLIYPSINSSSIIFEDDGYFIFQFWLL